MTTKIMTLLTISLLWMNLYSQISFYEIDIKSQPSLDSLSTTIEIADFLTKELTTDIEKVRAIYIWISHNISYDLNQMNSGKRYNSSSELTEEVLKSRKGVCQHYSQLFQELCENSGITSYLISGYTRNAFGDIDVVNHSWNGVVIDSTHYFIDVTWASGFRYNGKYIQQFRDDYFLITPGEFIRDHMPFDPIWQFLDSPMSYENFDNKVKLHEDSSSINFAFCDSITKYNGQSQLTKYISEFHRISNVEGENKHIIKQLNELELQITNAKYNIAIDTLNAGIDTYNAYVTSKNKQFRNPKIEDKDLQEMINLACANIHIADSLLLQLESSNKELSDLIIVSRQRMPALKADVTRESKFVDKYLSKWKIFRDFMFYSYVY